MEQNGISEETPDNVVTLTDENGEQFQILTFGDTNFPLQFLKMGPEKRLSYVKNFSYKDGDVLLCSYPKTGTHWTANILHYLMYDGPLENMISYQPCLIDIFDIEGVQQREGRRIYASHLPPARLPVEHFERGGKTILVFRNPKDTATSLFHHFRKLKVLEFKLSWNSYIEYWLEGNVPFGSYFDYYNRWQQFLEEKPKRDILVVQYEDLKKDGVGELRRIQNYLGLNHPDERLQAVLDKCSMGNLKADIDNGRVKSKLVDDSGKSFVYRKGIIGDWKTHFTVAQSDMTDKVVAEKFKDSMFSYKACD